MSTATLVSVDEYLTTTYRPDCDFIDGVLEERNVGTNDHSALQGAVYRWVWERGRTPGFRPFIEQRIRVSQRRYRVPDICVVPLPKPEEQIFTQPPYICIEILSPNDTFPKLQARFDDYLAMGVPNIWVLDPGSRRGWTITRQGHLEALDGKLRTTDKRLIMPLADLFQPED
jgi:Uma2 family endonuclease